MQICVLKSKIQRVKVTKKSLYYEGSIGIDKLLMKAARIYPNEQVHVLNVTTGERFITYAIAEEEGSGEISLNGAAARLGEVGDELILLTYGYIPEEEIFHYKPRILHVGEGNRPPD